MEASSLVGSHRGNKGEIVFQQSDMRESGLNELLYLSYRSALRCVSGKSTRPTTRLADCAGYLQAVCGGFFTSQGWAISLRQIFVRLGQGPDRIYSVQKAIDLIRDIARSKRRGMV